MDEPRPPQRVPERLAEIEPNLVKFLAVVDPEVMKFFASLQPDDVPLIKSGMELARWSRTTGRLTRYLFLAALTLFGAIQGWDWIVTRFFSAKTGN